MPTGIYDRPLGKCAAWIFVHANHEGAECLIWPFTRLADGYGTLGYKGDLRRAHVMMCEIANGPAPTPEHEAAHNCGNGHIGCCHPKHLEWKTRSANQRDRYKNERKSRKGTPRTRLTPEQVVEIRQLRGIETQQSLADRFGVSRTNIIMVQNGETWNNRSHRFLSANAIRQIRANKDIKILRDQANEHGVSQMAIWRIVNGKSYKHIS